MLQLLGDQIMREQSNVNAEIERKQLNDMYFLLLH